MGTRGIVGFVVDGEEKISYNHFDSYPSGVGVEVLNWAINVTNWETIKKLARDLMIVSDEEEPTAEQIEVLMKYHDDHVSTGYPTEWYSLLRHTQGNPAKILEAGFMEDAGNFPLDSLFCEWGYVVDLDEERLEVYQGFQHEAHSEGRFAGRADDSGQEHRRGDKYYPIKLVASFPLKDLPTSSEFCAKLESTEEAA